MITNGNPAGRNEPAILEMLAFDALPTALRHQLNYTRRNFSAVHAVQLLQGKCGGDAAILARSIDHLDAQPFDVRPR